MYEYLAESSYKNSKSYRRKAKKMSKQFGLTTDEINKIVGKRMEQKYPTLIEDLFLK